MLRNLCAGMLARPILTKMKYVINPKVRLSGAPIIYDFIRRRQFVFMVGSKRQIMVSKLNLHG